MAVARVRRNVVRLARRVCKSRRERERNGEMLALGVTSAVALGSGIGGWLGDGGEGICVRQRVMPLSHDDNASEINLI
jgi:hypothetical protein